MPATKEKVQSIIKDHPVVVFSKSYCPYCRETLRTISGMGAEAYVLQLDEIDDGSDIQKALKEISHQSTVPNTFISGKHIGGNDKLQSIAAGELKSLLKNAGALKGGSSDASL